MSNMSSPQTVLRYLTAIIQSYRRSDWKHYANYLIGGIYLPGKGPARRNESCEAAEKNVNVTNTLSVLFTNADCLLNKRSELQLRLNQTTPKPDIIGVVEVKRKNYKELPQLSEYNLEDYDVCCSNVDCIHGRGIILYTAPWLKASCYNLQSRVSDVLESLYCVVAW